jgi:hypothetical protein
MHDRRNRGAPWRWRPRLVALVGVLALMLAVAACGGGGGGKANGVASLTGANKPTTTTAAGPPSKQDAQQAALAFARCMRQHGINMPDPKVSGNKITQELPGGRGGGKGPDDPTFKAAQQACNKYLPNGGQPIKPDPQEQQQMLAFARCMRQHGIDLPDPNPNGDGIVIGPKTGVNPDDPKFKAAEQACQQYAPKDGEKQTQHSGGDNK